MTNAMDESMVRTWEGDAPLLHEVMRRAGERYVPWQAAIEVTYRCNLRCRHCYVDDDLKVGKRPELAAQEWREVLDQLAAAGTLHLLVTGGEPLLRPDLPQILEAAAERGFFVALLTNGTLLSAEWVARLRDLHPHFVGTSLYGATPNTHDMVTRQRGSFGRTIGAVRSLLDAGLTVVVQATMMAGNVGEVATMRSLAEEMGAIFSLGYSLVPTKGCGLGPQALEATAGAALEQLRTDPSVTVEPHREGPGICQAGRGICSVAPDGELYPCLLMPLPLANLRDRAFGDIWWHQPPEALERLRALSPADWVACQGCAYAPFCFRCPGAALGETGSLTGRPPSSCRAAAIRARLYHTRKGGSRP